MTSLLLYLLDRGVIDGAIVSQRTGTFLRQPRLATTRDEVLAASGSHFAIAPHLEQLGQQYTTYSPTVSAVQSLNGERLRHVALVGTPCQVHTVRKMQSLGIVPSESISLVIGLFCMESFVFDAEVARRLLGGGVDVAQIAKLNVKDDLIVSMRDGTVHHVSFDEVDAIARPACLACTDFANDYADLSVGGLGSPDGYTTVLVRSDKAALAYDGALRAGHIEERQYPDLAARSADRAKLLASVVGFAGRKRERGEVRRAGVGARADAGEG